MKKYNYKKMLLISLLLIILILIIIPFIKIKVNNKLIFIKYNDDISKYDNNHCYHENVSYYKEKDISITNFNIDKYLFFYLFTLEYEKGNLCEREFLLEEKYIENFVQNAEIIENPKNINISKLIKDKKAIVGNTRYTGNDYETYMYYKLDGKEEVLYVFYQDDLLIIQIGFPDEITKFIAYK